MTIFRGKKKRALGLSLLLFTGLSSLQASEPERLHIAVASNFKQTLEVLITAFQSQAENAQLQILSSSGSSGVLFAQITKGAPYDVFLSADAMRPDQLIEKGLALKHSRKVYAQGQIALWMPAYSASHEIAPLSIEVFAKGGQTYTLANPKLAPYGLAAKALMQEAGWWKAKDRQRIMAQNIAGAFQYIASGAVTLGWVAVAQLKAWEKQHALLPTSYWLPDTLDYPAIEQVAVRLKKSSKVSSAQSFFKFLSAPEAQSLIKSHGYLIPQQ